MPQPLINITYKQAIIFAIFLLIYECLTYMANDLIMPGMLKVVESFNGPESAVASSLTAYILGGASLQLLLGPLSDRYGRRPVMIAGAILFLCCSIFIALSQSMEQFLVARYFQGMGLCFIAVIGYATLQEIFAEMDAIRLIAIMANISILAPLLGPLLGAIFIHFYNWRYIFFNIAIGALIALVGLWRFMPETIGEIKRNGEKIPIVPFLPRVIIQNYKNLILNRSFLFGSLGLGFLNLPCVSWIALAPVILVSEGKLTVIQYGLWQLPIFGASIIGNIVLHRLTHYFSVKKILSLGSTVVGMSLLITWLLPQLSGSYSFLWLIPGLIVYFFAIGVSNAPLNRLILFSTSVAKGTTSALMHMIAMFTQGAGILVANWFYRNHSNASFGLFSAICASLYVVFVYFAYFHAKGNAVVTQEMKN